MSRFYAREQRAVMYESMWGAPPPRTASGMEMNETRALTYSAVYGAVTLIADALAFLPIELKIKQSDGTLTPTDMLPWVRNPHPSLRREDVFTQFIISLLLWGNAYAFILRRPSDSAITGLLPMDPSTVECRWARDREGKETAMREYRIGGKGDWYDSTQIFHIMGPSKAGRAVGMSIVTQAREAFALGLTLEDFGARFFAQSAIPKVVLVIPGRQLDEQQAKLQISMFERWHAGSRNWHRPAIASGGADIKTIQIPPEDAQFLETRKFQLEEVARWFRLPPHRLSMMDRQTSWGSGLAEENTAMHQMTFRPWIQRLELAYTAYLPGGPDRGVVVRLDDSSLLRGSFKEQVDAWTKASGGPIATPNEARKAMGFGPIEGGEELRPGALPGYGPNLGGGEGGPPTADSQTGTSDQSNMDGQSQGGDGLGDNKAKAA